LTGVFMVVVGSAGVITRLVLEALIVKENCLELLLKFPSPEI